MYSPFGCGTHPINPQLFPDVVPQQMSLRVERLMQSGDAAAAAASGLASLEIQHRTLGGAAEQHGGGAPGVEHSFGAVRLGSPQTLAAAGASPLTTSLCTLAVVGCVAAVLALPLMFARVTNAPS
jgi:hypothetical protein